MKIRVITAPLAVVLTVAVWMGSVGAAAAQSNPIQVENAKPGPRLGEPAGSRGVGQRATFVA